jgi:hypothetical protein
MRRIILVFGLIAGGIMSVMMLVQMSFMDQIGFDKGEIIGYTTMVVSFLLVYFGIRAYKETLPGRTISFGQAFKVGAAISVIAIACYVVTWEVIYYKFMPDFGDKYGAHVLEAKKAKGVSAAELDETRKQMQEFKEMYRNPLVNVAYTFMEPLPVALLLTLVSAGVHSRKKGRELTNA